MSVGNLLGLDEGGELLARARERWAAWAAEDARLRVVDDFDGLRDWLLDVDRAQSDSILHALATLAATDGADDVAAAGALAKCLLPGACSMAARFRTLILKRVLTPSLNGSIDQVVDDLVASQLWIQVRTFPWRRRRLVASNILMDTRAGVLYELNDNTWQWRTDRTWANTTAHEAVTRGDFEPEPRLSDVGLRPSFEGLMAADFEGSTLSPPEQLLKVLAWGCNHEVITSSDRNLLLLVVKEAETAPAVRPGCRRSGLLSTDLAAKVAPHLGVSGVTIRRRVARSIAALEAAVPRELIQP
jgi:hypothetical protein